MAALPFVLERSDDVISGDAVTSTTERIHGLLRTDGEFLVIQWRLARETDHVRAVIRTDHEYEPVREVYIPLRGSELNLILAELEQERSGEVGRIARDGVRGLPNREQQPPISEADS